MKFTPELSKLALLTGYFVILAILFYTVQLGNFAWLILLASAIAWFDLEAKNRKKGELQNAMKIGAFLLVFDFIFENTGWIFGLWQTWSAFAVGVVPIEVMGIAFFGGTAWALYLPKKFSMMHSLIDSFIFGFFGALGEWLLIQQGLFAYYHWWTSMLAFATYFGTWLLLHFIKYRIIK